VKAWSLSTCVDGVEPLGKPGHLHQTLALRCGNALVRPRGFLPGLAAMLWVVASYAAMQQQRRRASCALRRIWGTDV